MHGQSLFEPTDVVGIKINPSGAPACCSSPEIVREIISSVQSVGVPARNIVVYDRYSYEMDIGSYQALLPAGVRIVGIQERSEFGAGYDPTSIVMLTSSESGKPAPTWQASCSRSDQDHQRADNEGPLGFRCHWGSQESGLRHIQQCGAFTSCSVFLYQPIDRLMCTVEPLRSKAVAAHHGRYAAGVAWRSAHPGPGIHRSNRHSSGGDGSRCYGQHRTRGD